MGEIVPFVFQHDQKETEIRTLKLDGEPWFVAADLGCALVLENIRMALKNLGPEERGVTQIYTPGGPQSMTIVSESGMYELIFISEKPAAKVFRRWVRKEVLPSIRRTGRYELPAAAREPELLTAINGVQATLVDHGRLLGDLIEVTRRRREDFSVATQRYVAQNVAILNDCKCIYCDAADVVTKTGRTLGNSDWHHANGNRNDHRRTNATLPCKECHKRMNNPNRPDHIPDEDARAIARVFHLKASNRAKQIKSSHISGNFWNFAGAEQAHMGWPIARKKRTTS